MNLPRHPTSDSPPWRVFISYTAEDLKDYADAAGKVVRQLGWIAVDHRDWVPSGRPTVYECIDQIRTCDILVVLVAHRYGWVPTVEQGGDGERSITWIEVDYARKRGLEIIPFVVADTEPWPPNLIEGLLDATALQRLNRFKAEIRPLHCGFFSSPTSIEGPLAITLQNANKPSRSVIVPNTPSREKNLDFQSQKDAFTQMLRKCLYLNHDDELLIIYDESLTEFLPAFVDVVSESQLSTTWLSFPKQHQLAYRRDLSRNAAPLGIRTALAEAVGIITCLDGDRATSAVRADILSLPRRAGSRLLHVPGISQEILRIAAATDFDGFAHNAKMLAEVMKAAHRVQLVTSDELGNEYALSVSMQQLEVEPTSRGGMIPLGFWGNMPLGHIFFCPSPSSVSGMVCVNGSIPGLTIDGGESVILTFENGVLLRETGSSSVARSFFDTQRQSAEARGDGAWNLFAEFGIGLNTAITSIVGNPIIDTRMYGTAYIAIGDNRIFGGTISSDVHLDLVIMHPTLLVDDHLVMDKGNLCLIHGEA